MVAFTRDPADGMWTDEDDDRCRLESTAEAFMAALLAAGCWLEPTSADAARAAQGAFFYAEAFHAERKRRKEAKGG